MRIHLFGNDIEAYWSDRSELVNSDRRQSGSIRLEDLSSGFAVMIRVALD